MLQRISLAFVGCCIAVAGVVVIGAGARIGLGRPEPIGGMLIGFGVALLGLDGVVTGRVTIPTAGHWRAIYGWPARFNGAITTLGGIVVCIGAIFEMRETGASERALGTPRGTGALALGIGLLALLGSGLFFTTQQSGPRAVAFLFSLWGRLIGALLFLIGLLFVTGGAMQIIAPGSVEAVAKQLLMRMASR